ncbi:hypothetical protein [Pedobacter jeongneungensis]|uniref:hypothetical protein n=1 Tax=Pedobacter jeongneungensis TaxID=947309 RepID=UPI0004684C16|nr:hypothetical protein [Pedobacter jeongneungensis]
MSGRNENQTALLFRYISIMTRDKKIKVIHMVLILAIFQIGITEGMVKTINISRKRVMEHAHIHSIATYHRYIKELILMGYIRYQPSYHPRYGSLVNLIL